jgi:hypothetical protein
MHFDPESHVVDVHAGNLRRKLTEAAGEPLLATVRGVGFSLRRGHDAEILPVADSACRAALLPARALLFILIGVPSPLWVRRAVFPHDLFRLLAPSLT